MPAWCKKSTGSKRLRDLWPEAQATPSEPSHHSWQPNRDPQLKKTATHQVFIMFELVLPAVSLLQAVANWMVLMRWRSFFLKMHAGSLDRKDCQGTRCHLSYLKQNRRPLARFFRFATQPSLPSNGRWLGSATAESSVAVLHFDFPHVVPTNT